MAISPNSALSTKNALPSLPGEGSPKTTPNDCVLDPLVALVVVSCPFTTSCTVTFGLLKNLIGLSLGIVLFIVRGLVYFTL